MVIGFAVVIAALFAVGAAIIGVASLLPTGRDVRQLWWLFATEFGIVGAVVVAVLHPWALAVAATLLGLRAYYEMVELCVPAAPRAALGVGLAAAAATIVGGRLAGQVWPFAAAGLAAAALAGWLAARGPALAATGVNLAAAVVYPVVPIAYLGLFAGLDDGLAWVLYLYIVVETNDAFALVFGKLIGRRPVFPRLSPGKTLEGLIAGLVFGVGVGVGVAVAVFGLPPASAAGAAAVVLAAAIAGDAVTSGVKRLKGRKNFAAVLDVHGGVLDIYDSLVFTAPFFYAYHRLFLG